MNKQIEEFEALVKKALEKCHAGRPQVDLTHSAECPDPLTFARFCGHELSDAEHERFLKHISECPGCLSDVAFYFKEIRPCEMAQPPEEIELLLNGEKRDISVQWLLPGRKAKIPNIKEVGDYEVRYGDISLRFGCAEEDLFVSREELKEYRKAADTEGGRKLKTIAGDQITVIIHRGKARRNQPPSGAVFEVTIRRKD